MKTLKIEDRTGSWAVVHALDEYGRHSAEYFHLASEHLKNDNAFDSERWEAFYQAREVYARELNDRLILMSKDIEINEEDKPEIYQGYRSLLRLAPKGNSPEILSECLRGENQFWEATKNVLDDPNLDRTTRDLLYRLSLHIEASISLIVSWSFLIDNLEAEAI